MGRKNYSVQVFKTMQCNECKGPFDNGLAAYCHEIFVPATLHFSYDHGFKCQLQNIVLLFRRNFMFLPKSTQNTQKPIL